MTREEVASRAEKIIASRHPSDVTRIESIQHFRRLRGEDRSWHVETWTLDPYHSDMGYSVTTGIQPDIAASGNRAAWWTIVCSLFPFSALVLVLDETGEFLQLTEIHNWSS